MNVLGMNTGLGASICLLENGLLLLALEEERLTRVKNGGGFPRLALQYAYEHHRGFMENLDAVGICDFEDQMMTMDELQGRYYRRFHPDDRSPIKRTLLDVYNGLSSQVPVSLKRAVRPRGDRVDLVAETRAALPGLDLPDERFKRLRHHDCHAAAAYYGLARSWSKPYLVMTLDGGGDRECGSVSIAKDGWVERVTGVGSAHTVGGIYSAVTYLMGFKPHEHEYKIMGLAPYTPERYGDEVYQQFRKYVRLDPDKGLHFEKLIDEKLGNAGLRYAEDFRYVRFDNLAVGLQRFTEDIVCEWIRNAIRETGISDLLLSGGVFMNIKMNKKIAEMAEVGSVDVFPSCGDETNAFGIAYFLQATSGANAMPMLGTFCTGPRPDCDLEEVKAEVSNEFAFAQVDNPEQKVAELLADGHVVARCAGPMEFGARALGNRSLLADPTVPGVVERINRVIKQRDFWMPFAPAVLAEDAADYIVIPRTLPPDVSPYMMFGFETVPERRAEMAAALHKADQTARAQVVDARRYPRFHQVISAFKSLTGRSVVLNTSFNLHGLPIVMGARDALHVMRDSDLEYLVIEDTLITKRQ